MFHPRSVVISEENLQMRDNICLALICIGGMHLFSHTLYLSTLSSILAQLDDANSHFLFHLSLFLSSYFSLFQIILSSILSPLSLSLPSSYLTGSSTQNSNLDRCPSFLEDETRCECYKFPHSKFDLSIVQ